jgi:RNA polymerase sigma-70 factor (ECF subfamily)
MRLYAGGQEGSRCSDCDLFGRKSTIPRLVATPSAGVVLTQSNGGGSLIRIVVSTQPGPPVIIIYPWEPNFQWAPTPLSSMPSGTQAKEHPTSDQTLLVLLAQSGDRAALEQLLRDVYSPLRRYITRLVGAALADDILQETSLQIFRKLPFLREPAVFRPWTFRIASRIAFSHLKRARRWQPLDDAPPEHLTTLNSSLDEPPDEGFLTLIDNVSPASRAVLLLRYQHDLTLEETAAILEIPIGTAKSRLHYGVTTLRKYLTSERKPT